MQCKNTVVFKGIEERSGGTFKNDKGENINYDKAFVVKFDENVNEIISERKVKFPGTNLSLFTKFKTLKPYDKIEIVFDVAIQNNGCKLTVSDFNQIK